MIKVLYSIQDQDENHLTKDLKPSKMGLQWNPNKMVPKTWINNQVLSHDSYDMLSTLNATPQSLGLNSWANPSSCYVYITQILNQWWLFESVNMNEWYTCIWQE